MRRGLAALLIGVLSAAVAAGVAGAGPAAGRKAPAWITIRSLATNYQFGELPTKAHQRVLGRVRLDHIARVSSVVIDGKRRTGDLLVIEGAYQNLANVPSYWTAGYAFTLGTKPVRCTMALCGITPTEGVWARMSHEFGTPIVDYPAKRTVAPQKTVTFREAIPMPAGAHAGDAGATADSVIRSMRDVWLLPIYAAFNYYEQPFPPSQLVRLSDYFGQVPFPRR